MKKLPTAIALIFTIFIIRIIYILIIIDPEYRLHQQLAFKEDSYFFDEKLKKMSEGSIIFNDPDSIMQYEEKLLINLLLSVPMSPIELEQEIEKSIANSPIESYRIKVSNIMEANLIGDGFDIIPITPEKQAVSKLELTEWKWEIIARKPGIQRLHLTINAIIHFEGETVPRSIKTFEKEIKVEVTLTQRMAIFINSNWQWLWVTIIVPLYPLIRKYVKNYRKKRQIGFEK
ncbi:MAG: hypothetical protein V3V99_05710 [candidate division Zixibacteria bacterium]